MLSVSANGESMGGPWWKDRSDVLLCGCGTGRPGLQACLLWPVLGIPHESPVADEVSWAWEQLCVAWPHRWERTSPIQPSALPRSAAALSHCCHGLKLGCGPGKWSRESNWPLSANQAFSLDKLGRRGDFFFFLPLILGFKTKIPPFSSLYVFPTELQGWQVSRPRCGCSPFNVVYSWDLTKF